MSHYFLVYAVPVLLVLLFYISVVVGRNVGVKHIKNHTHPTTEVVSAAEAAVFGLLALLIAFTFSGAYERYENRKMSLVEEANAFEKAYNYIDLVPKNYQEQLRTDVKHYLDLYISAYNNYPDMAKINADLSIAHEVENQIWHTAVKAGSELQDKTYTQIYMPAFNQMFEVAHKSYDLTRVHPPEVIFVLLIGLSVLGAFLIGYSSAANLKHPLHSWCYIALTALTIYVVLNMEFPRMGFIGMKVFDQILAEVRVDMK